MVVLSTFPLSLHGVVALAYGLENKFPKGFGFSYPAGAQSVFLLTSFRSVPSTTLMYCYPGADFICIS